MIETVTTFTNPETFTEAFFLEHYEHFMDLFQNGDAHPECALGDFYYKFISEDKSLLTEEVKKEWAEEWVDDLGEDLEGLTSFDEILDENDYLMEDLADWFIENNEACLEKWKPCLYQWITEMWSTYAINEAIKEIA